MEKIPDEQQLTINLDYWKLSYIIICTLNLHMGFNYLSMYPQVQGDDL